MDNSAVAWPAIWLRFAVRRGSIQVMVVGSCEEQAEGALENLLGISVGLDATQSFARLIEVVEWPGFVLVNAEPNADRFRLIIFSLDEWLPAMVADVRDGWRLGRRMKYGLTGAAGTATRKARDDFFQGKFIADYRIQAHAQVVTELVECLRLTDGPWKAVDEKASLAVQAARSFSHHGNDQLVGNQLTAVHRLQGFSHGGRCGTVAFGGAEQIAGRKMAGPQLLAEQPCLGSFPDARRPEQNETTGRVA